MWIGIVTLFPEMFAPLTGAGVLGRAVREGGLELAFFNPRDHALDRHRTVDDRPYGGGPGMVMRVEPLLGAIEAARAAWRARSDAANTDGAGAATAPVVYLSPQGPVFRQEKARAFAGVPGLILVAGRYEGVDERAIELAVDEELSIGDYVLTGGELPAMVVIDAVARHLPGTLGNSASALAESHLDGLLDYPHYTRPENAGGREVPPVLLTGDHAAVRRWRRKEALGRTWTRRPELLAGRDWTPEDRNLLEEFLAETAGRNTTGNTDAST
jgi:tRNA (guanine37-N1)-methyltransferase